REFYTVDGAFALRDVLPRFERGSAIVGVCGKSFKCPPAPSETALLLHDYLTARGRREATEISVVMPFGTPIPPSPETSQAILAAFAERGITFVKVDVDFLSGPKPRGTFQEPSAALVAEKAHFGSSRVQRWFGRAVCEDAPSRASRTVRSPFGRP
ncbi:MAG: hypothetical protein ABW292_17455, partial [Vicinamibacterales bacterium]